MNLKSGKDYLSRLLGKSLVRNTAWMLLAQGLGIGMQLVTFVIVARALGVQDYGTFMGITAFAAILVPFTGIGSGDILVQNVAKDRSVFRQYWGIALLTTLSTGIVLSAVSFIIVGIIIPGQQSALSVLAILFSDLVLLKLWECSTKAFMSIDWVSITATLKVFLSFNKFLAALSLIVFFKGASITTWAMLYFLATAVTSIACVILVNRLVGTPVYRLPRSAKELTQGIFFSISASSDSISASIDKTMLASLATAQATGLYAAAYRCIEVGYLGFHALSGAAYARFFQQGATGISGCLAFAKRLFPAVFGYGVITCAGFLVLAPVIPYILGAEYVSSIEAVRWLSPVPLLLALQYLAADTLTGAGFQGRRSGIQVVSAVINISLNFWLIPLFSWKGAAWATLTSEVFKLLSLCLIVFFLYRQQRRTSL